MTVEFDFGRGVNQMEMSQYLEVFIEESKEHLQSCNDHLLELEKNPSDINIIQEIFRSAHTLKGMSATMGFDDLAKLTHQMENVLDGIRHQTISVTPDLLDVVLLAVEDVEEMVQSIASGGDGKRDVHEIVEKLKMIEKGQSPNEFEGHKEVAAAVAEVENNIVYDEFERTVIQQSQEQGYHTYEIMVSLRSDCLLKAARVFMVFEVLEKIGEVIKSTPSVEELEEEKFDQLFAVTIITTEETEEIEKKISKVSEVENVTVVSVTLDKIGFDYNPKNEKSETDLSNRDDSKIDQPKNEELAGNKESVQPKQQQAGKTVNKTIRVNIERLDILLNLFEELVIDRGRLEQISSELNNQELQETVDRMSRTTGDLQNIILNMRMVPIETVFNRFPRMVRQLSRDLQKKVNIEIIGAETELDRTVIDEIGDPLVHLIRNSLDHGIEAPEVRKSIGKPEEGTVILKAYHSGNHVFIEIEDDGAGINRDRVLEKALGNGIVTEQIG